MDTKLFILPFIIFHFFTLKKQAQGIEVGINSNMKSNLHINSSPHPRSKHQSETKSYIESKLNSRYESATKQKPRWDIAMMSDTKFESNAEYKLNSKHNSELKSHFGHKSDSKHSLYLKPQNSLLRHKSDIRSKSSSKSKLGLESKSNLKTETDLNKGSNNLNLKSELQSKSNYNTKPRSKSQLRWRRRLRACDRLFDSINRIVDARLRQAGLNLDYTTPDFDLNTMIPSKVAPTPSLIKVQNLVQEVQEAQQVLSITQKELLTTLKSQSLRLGRVEHDLAALDSVVQNLSRVAEHLHHVLGEDVDSVEVGTTQMEMGVSPIPVTTEPSVLPQGKYSYGMGK